VHDDARMRTVIIETKYILFIFFKLGVIKM